jgi:hypothetical protein
MRHRAKPTRTRRTAIGGVAASSVTVEYHWLEGQFDGLPALMADLVRLRVAVIATTGATVPALDLEWTRPPTWGGQPPLVPGQLNCGMDHDRSLVPHTKCHPAIGQNHMI